MKRRIRTERKGGEGEMEAGRSEKRKLENKRRKNREPIY